MHIRNIAVFFILAIFYTLPAMAESDAWGLTDLQGNPRTIDEFASRDKWLVVMFWAQDCPICNREAHEYAAFHKQHSGHDAIVLGVSIDGKAKIEQARTFVQKHKLPFQSLIGDPGVIATVYFNETGTSWFGTPTFMIFNPGGGLEYNRAGPVSIKLLKKMIREYKAKPANSPETSSKK